MLKVYTGLLPKGLAPYSKNVEKVRTIIAARSLREAAMLLGYSHGTIKNFFDISTDKDERVTANKSPGSVYQSSSMTDNDYKIVKQQIANNDGVDDLHYLRKRA